jgi:Xaa-Pro aminopeptidase
MLDVTRPSRAQSSIPFDADRLDRLMDEAGVDVLCVTSKHNVQYLLGGHRAFFFDYMDAMGVSRYLPIVLYPKRPKAGYFSHRMEGYQKENAPFWVAEAQTNSSASLDVMEKAIDTSVAAGSKPQGLAWSFLCRSMRAMHLARRSGSELVDAVVVLERLRAIECSGAREAAHRVRRRGSIPCWR